jgi:CP family cyanate transporter-like MFS transporter
MVLLGIVIAAFNLRVAIAGVGPVIDDVQADTGMSSAMAGVLTTIPFVFTAAFSFAGMALVTRMSPARIIGVSLVFIAAGTLARAAMPSALGLIAATVPIGIGIALAGVGLPGVAKAHFPSRPGVATGAYVASLSVGGGLTAATIVPLADAFGDWRWAFAATAAPALLALPLWTWAVGDSDDGQGLERVRPVSLRPSRTALGLGLLFGAQSMTFSGTITWIAALYTEAGWDPAHAALTTASVPLFSVPAAILATRLSDGRDRRAWVAGTAVVVTVAMLGLALAPAPLAWLWAPLFGLGTGALFPLVLTLPMDLRESAVDSTDLTVWMLGLGYLMSAVAPMLMGALRDWTGGFEAAFGFLALMGALCAMLALGLKPRRAREGGRDIPDYS